MHSQHATSAAQDALDALMRKYPQQPLAITSTEATTDPFPDSNAAQDTTQYTAMATPPLHFQPPYGNPQIFERNSDQRTRFTILLHSQTRRSLSRCVLPRKKTPGPLSVISNTVHQRRTPHQAKNIQKTAEPTSRRQKQYTC
jgi:hypothetical protein